MGAAEKVLSPESSLQLQGRNWDRMREPLDTDNNSGIENFVGRTELSSSWQINKANTLGATVRRSLRRESKGLTRIDWLMSPTASPGYTGLGFHVQ